MDWALYCVRRRIKFQVDNSGIGALDTHIRQDSEILNITKLHTQNLTYSPVHIGSCKQTYVYFQGWFPSIVPIPFQGYIFHVTVFPSRDICGILGRVSSSTVITPIRQGQQPFRPAVIGTPTRKSAKPCHDRRRPERSHLPRLLSRALADYRKMVSAEGRRRTRAT